VGRARKPNNTASNYDRLIAYRKGKGTHKSKQHQRVKVRVDYDNIYEGLPIARKKKKRLNSKPVQTKTSAGERLVASFLINAGVSFRREWEFSDCKNPKTGMHLRFDFYIPSQNTCIEFDGEQHFKYVPEFDGDNKTEWKNRQYRDSIKDMYCQQSDIVLIRIRYDEKDKLPEILKSCLK